MNTLWLYFSIISVLSFIIGYFCPLDYKLKAKNSASKIFECIKD